MTSRSENLFSYKSPKSQSRTSVVMPAWELLSKLAFPSMVRFRNVPKIEHLVLPKTGLLSVPLTSTKKTHILLVDPIGPACPENYHKKTRRVKLHKIPNAILSIMAAPRATRHQDGHSRGEWLCREFQRAVA